MDNQEQAYLDLGYLHARVIIEMVGKPKEHVEETLKKYVALIEKDEKIKLVRKYFAESREIEGMFSTFVELEGYFKGISTLVGFCFDYMPSSIEILAPVTMAFTNQVTSNMLNDLQAKLHTMDMMLKKLNNENEFLRKNIDLLLKNYITILLHNRRLSLEQLSTLIGIPKEGLIGYLDTLVQQEKIKKDGNDYFLQ
ncbi:hypothetical protein HY639_01070 [Candidatus Woesearchaeota archaeon]|nr:hypothetical protein [Candidatus Woesearchaeota archaeon]